MQKMKLSKDMLFSSTGVYNADYYSLGHLIDNSNNDDSEGFYWLGCSKNGYLLITLKHEVLIKQINIAPYCRSDTYSNYKISISNDNKNFDEVVPFTTGKKNMGEFYMHTINRVCKYIRLDFKTSGSWGDCLNDIEIYKNDVLFLLHKNDKFYSIKKENYDAINNKFVEVEKDFGAYGFYLEDLYKNIYDFNYKCNDKSCILNNTILQVDKKFKFKLFKDEKFYTISANPKILNALGTYSSIGSSASNINAIFNPDTKLSNRYYWDDGSGSREGLSIEFNDIMLITKIELYSTDNYPLGNVKFEIDGKEIYSQGKVSQSSPMFFEGIVAGKKVDIVRYLVKDSVIQKIVVYGLDLKSLNIVEGDELLDSDYIYYLNFLSNKTDYEIIVSDCTTPVNLIYKLDKPFRPIDKFSGKIELIRQTENRP